MKQYLDLLQNILDNGVEKESGRENMPNTIGISHGVIQMDMKDGFPLLTTKKMFFKGVITELLWILKGSTNIKYLVDNNVHIWDSDAYRWYLKHYEMYADPEKDGKVYTIEEFVETCKSLPAYAYKAFKGSNYTLGDLGKVYGYQWRNQNGVDQVRDVIKGLQDNPYSRYHIIDAWNAADRKEQALPPCHLLYQFIVRPLSEKERYDYFFENIFYKDGERGEFVMELIDSANTPKFYLDLNMYQRSVDSACGLPFNLASMSLLLQIISKTSNMIPGVATWIGGDTHVYAPHIETVKEQIKRTPYKLPNIKILKDIKTIEDIEKLNIDDFELSDYQSHDKLNYELFTGLKK